VWRGELGKEEGSTEGAAEEATEAGEEGALPTGQAGESGGRRADCAGAHIATEPCLPPSAREPPPPPPRKVNHVPPGAWSRFSHERKHPTPRHVHPGAWFRLGPGRIFLPGLGPRLPKLVRQDARADYAPPPPSRRVS
jgi:hypothetical protein